MSWGEYKMQKRMKKLCACLAVSLLAAFTGTAWAQGQNTGDDYPRYIAPGKTPEGLACTMTQVWVTGRILQPYPRTPLVVDASGVYTGNDFVYGLDRKTGEVRWTFEMPQAHDAAFGASGVNAMAVDNRNVYFGGYASRLVALDKATGEKKWHFDVESVIREAVVADNERVYFTIAGVIYVLNKKSGEVEWSVEKVGGAPAVDGQYTYIVSSQGFSAFNKTNGNPVWEVPDQEGGKYMPLRTAPYVYAGQVMVATFGSSNGINGLDIRTGEVLWSYNDHVYGDARAVLGQDNRYVLIYTASGLLVLYDLEARKPVWRFQTPGGKSYMPPVLYKGVILLSSERRGIYGIDYRTGQEVLRFEYIDKMSREEGLREARALQVYEDMLYMTSIDGDVRAYRLDCPQFEGRD